MAQQRLLEDSMTSTVGASAKSAVRFVQQIHKDIRSFIDAMDELLGKPGWTPTPSNKVSDDLGNGINDTWLIENLFRIYVPTANLKSTNRAITFHLLLNPPESYEEPTVLFFAVKYSETIPPSQIWNEWTADGSETLLNALAGQFKSTTIGKNALNEELFPGASSALALPQPLCGFGSEKDVRE